MQRSWDELAAFFRSHPVLLFLPCWLTFVIFKIPHLGLPYFWDEAWSYIPAINVMKENGLSLLPDALPPDFSRGHPLLFYFLAAFWMKSFGDSVVAMHSFALFISSSLLFLIYYVGLKLFSLRVALLSVIILCFQAVFLAQSSFVLPEIILTFWALLCVYLFVFNRLTWFVLAGSMMLLTKETGIVVLFSIGLWFSIYMAAQRKIFSKYYFKKVSIILIPVFIASIYFFIQYAYYGWFFFPDHIKMIHFDKKIFLGTLSYCFEVLTNHQGRKIFSIMALSALIIMKFSGNKLFSPDSESKQMHFMGISFIFILVMFTYSSLNFFTDRYLLCLLPVYILNGSAIMIKTTRKWPIYFSVLCMIPCFSGLSYNLKSYEPSDNTLSYLDGVAVQRDVTRFAEEQLLYDKKIGASFLFLYCLGVPETKFRSTATRFTNLNSNLTCDNDYFIYSNIEMNSSFPAFREKCKLNLIKRFQRDKVWAEFYKVVK